jgi:mRNA interferase RelE/StbE
VTQYRILVDTHAQKALARLDKPVRRRVQRAIDRLADEPRPKGVCALAGLKGLLRIRVSDYRIIYTVRDSVLLVLVVDVGHRSTVYRRRD